MLNDEEVFFAFYPIVQHTVPIGRRSIPTYDVMGKDTVLFHRTIAADDHQRTPTLSLKRESGLTQCGPPSAAITRRERP